MICQHCGGEFEGRAGAVYCSNRCRQAAYRASKRNVTDTAGQGQAKSQDVSSALRLLHLLRRGSSEAIHAELLEVIRSYDPGATHRLLLALQMGNVTQATQLLRDLAEKFSD